MTRKEYLTKRQEYLDQMKAAIDAGNIDEANALEKKIKDLDDEFQRAATAQANYNALAGAQPVNFVAVGAQEPVQMQGSVQGNHQAVPVDPFDTEEYRNQFMNYALGRGPLPDAITNAAVAGPTTSTDEGAVIPTTTLREIVQNMKERGVIFNQLRHLNIQGGVEIPVLTLKPEATWEAETAAQAEQKIKADQKISFSYFQCECKISQTLLAAATTFAEFQALLIPLATEAVIALVEKGTFNADGNGKMTGIVNTTGIPTVEMTAAEVKTYAGWKKAYSKVGKAYRASGRWYMAQSTFDVYIDGMCDTTGQPVGRVNFGIDGEPAQRFAGKPVETTEEDVIVGFDDAAAGDCIAVFGNLQNYGFNSNMKLTAVEWIDHNTNKKYTKVMLIADGKVIDKDAFLVIKKKA